MSDRCKHEDMEWIGNWGFEKIQHPLLVCTNCKAWSDGSYDGNIFKIIPNKWYEECIKLIKSEYPHSIFPGCG